MGIAPHEIRVREAEHKAGQTTDRKPPMTSISDADAPFAPSRATNFPRDRPTVGQGPMCTQLATDGMPSAVTVKSM